MAKASKIFSIETTTLSEDGAAASLSLRHDQPAGSAKTAVAKAMFALNEVCDAYKLGIYLEVHDLETGKPLKVTFESAATPRA